MTDHNKPSTPRSILVVDDDFDLAEMLRDLLGDHGYEVTLAINGQLALAVLDERRIDLVITDMMMPVMDGAELAAALRQSRVHCHIPIVMMTSLPAAALHDTGLYDLVLRKPFTAAPLLTAIAACLDAGATA